jgi:hypothetical protein
MPSPPRIQEKKEKKWIKIQEKKKKELINKDELEIQSTFLYIVFIILLQLTFLIDRILRQRISFLCWE